MRLLIISLICLLPNLSWATGTGHDNKLKIVTTFSVIEDMVKNIVGPHADVVSITKRGAEIHGYRPTPRDIMETLDADIVFSNGLNLEAWFDQFIRHIGNVPNVTLTQGLEPIYVSEERGSDMANPHAWMSLNNAELYVQNIVNGLSQVDPFRSETYQQNGDAYIKALSASIDPLKAKLAQIDEAKRWLVTCEGAFGYLAKDLGLGELYIWPMNADQNGTPSQMRHVIETVRDHDIPVVFCESTISTEPALQIARETGARFGGVLYVDTLTDKEGPAATYKDLMVTTITRIVDELTKE